MLRSTRSRSATAPARRAADPAAPGMIPAAQGPGEDWHERSAAVAEVAGFGCHAPYDEDLFIRVARAPPVHGARTPALRREAGARGRRMADIGKILARGLAPGRAPLARQASRGEARLALASAAGLYVVGATLTATSA